MRIHSLKRLTIPKIAVLATGLVAAMLVATIHPMPAQATPSKARDCTVCHGSGSVAGTVTAKPNAATVAPGATYMVAISIATTASGNTGFWIANSTAAGATGTTTGVTGGPSAALSYAPTMTAPAAAGTYYYKVWANQGMDDSSAQTNFAIYSITVTAPTATPVSSFTASATSGTSPLAVTLTDTSTGAPTSWAWTFGNGTHLVGQAGCGGRDLHGDVDCQQCWWCWFGGHPGDHRHGPPGGCAHGELHRFAHLWYVAVVGRLD